MGGDGTPPAPTTATSLGHGPSPDTSVARDLRPMRATQRQGPPRRQRGFVLAVAEGSNQEVALSQLAVTNASSQQVKDFAQMMIRDHGLLNAQLGDLASSKGIDITEAVAKGQKKGVASLEKKQGADFDKAYLKEMVEGHDKTVKAFTKESEKGKDADIQAFATKNLPTIQMHDDHAHWPAAGVDVASAAALPMKNGQQERRPGEPGRPHAEPGGNRAARVCNLAGRGRARGRAFRPLAPGGEGTFRQPPRHPGRDRGRSDHA